VGRPSIKNEMQLTYFLCIVMIVLRPQKPCGVVCDGYALVICNKRCDPLIKDVVFIVGHSRVFRPTPL
jgi:hypothetical protein